MFDQTTPNYSKSNYSLILKEISNEDPNMQKKGLSVLCNLLTYGDSQLLSEFPIDIFCFKIMSFFEQSKNTEVLILASQCVFAFLEAHPRSTNGLINANLYPTLIRYLTDESIFNSDIGAYLIRSINVITNYRSSQIAAAIGLEPLFHFYDFFPLPEQRIAITAANRMTESYVNSSFSTFIPQIANLVSSSDKIISSKSLTLLNNLISKISISDMDMDDDVIKTICKLLENSTTSSKIHQYLNIIQTISNLQPLNVIDCSIDFSRFLLISDFDVSIQECALRIILHLIPFQSFFPQVVNIPFTTHSNGPTSENFARTIQPILYNAIFENPLSVPLLLLSYSGTLFVNLPKFSEDLGMELIQLISNPKNIPAVVSVLMHYDKEIFIPSSSIISTMRSKLKGDIFGKKWATTIINKINRSSSKIVISLDSYYTQLSLSDLCNLISSEKISRFHFIRLGCADHCLNLLKELTEEDSRNSKTHEQLLILAKFISDIIGMMPLPTTENAMLMKSIIDNFYILEIQTDFGIFSKNCHSFDSMYSLENIDPIFINKAKSIEPFNHLVAWPNMENMTPTQLGVLYHAVMKKPVPQFNIMGRSFSRSDQVLDLLGHIASNPQSITSIIPTLTVQPLDYFTKNQKKSFLDFNAKDREFIPPNFVNSYPVRNQKNMKLPTPHFPLSYLNYLNPILPKGNPFLFVQNPNNPSNDIAIPFHEEGYPKYIEGDPLDCSKMCFLSPIKVPTGLSSIIVLLKQLFHLLKPLSDSESSKIFINFKFIRRIKVLLSSPFEVFKNFQYASSIIKSIPFMFPFSLRVLVFKLSEFPAREAILAQQNEFGQQRNQKNGEMFKVIVRRNHLWDDGISILRLFGRSQIRLEVSFSGEAGIGLGPTHEFFTALSHEFISSSRHIFRNDSYQTIFNDNINSEHIKNDQSDTNYNINSEHIKNDHQKDNAEEKQYIWSRQGLYFSPSASDDDAAALGLFLAKALTMECFVDMDINPALIKFIRGQRVDPSEVDEILIKSLHQGSEGIIGLNFTYPGFPEIELKEGGKDIEVDEDNVSIYVQLVEQATVGRESLRNSFLKGFESVIPFGSLDMFTPKEICLLLRGEGGKLSQDDLDEGFELGNGYSKESFPVRALKEVLLEMDAENVQLFLKFVTGFNARPIGGIKKMRPKITIAKKIGERGEAADEMLPSVMTCSHYFKLPFYSSKEILREKLILAIHEGNESFQLT